MAKAVKSVTASEELIAQIDAWLRGEFDETAPEWPAGPPEGADAALVAARARRLAKAKLSAERFAEAELEACLRMLAPGAREVG